MKKGLLIVLAVLLFVVIIAQEKIHVLLKSNFESVFPVSTVDSAKVENNQSVLKIYKTDNSTESFNISDISRLYFTGIPDTVKFDYSNATVSVVNPLEGKGVDVSVNGGDVIVNSTLTDNEVIYKLSGSSASGSFKVYSTYRFELLLSGISLTNNDGPAINIQSNKHISVTLAAGTTNSLADGIPYTTSTEDQKGTFFSEGQLIFNGTGNLSVTGNLSHAICSDDYIEVLDGNITVTSAVKDAFHTNGAFKMEAGTLNLTAANDGIQTETGTVKIQGGSLTTSNTVADGKGINSFGRLTVSGGTILMGVGGNKSKGIKSTGIMTLKGGSITVNTSGAATLAASGSGFEPSYCTAIKCDSLINISGSTIVITSTGTGGKGISSDMDISMTSGSVNATTSGNGATYTNALGVVDAYTSSGIEADGNISIIAGSVTIGHSGTGSKGISADGTLTIGDVTNIPVVKITNTATKLLVSGTANYTTAVYAEPKNIKSDGNLSILNGTFTLSTSQQGAENIDSDSQLSISGGTFTMTVGGNQSKGLKSTGAMNISGGTFTITATGGVTLQNVAAATYDPSYCTAIKATGILTISGGNITITHSGAASKGISGDANINITGGVVNVTTSGAGTTYKNSTNVTDSYSANCISTDTNLSITGGNVTCKSTGSGGKGISVTGTITVGSATGSPTVNLTTTGAKFTVSGTDYCHPKTMVSDGAIAINNGIITISSTDDGMHSETSLTIAGGSTTITTSLEGIESKYIYITGGTNTITSTNDGINATMGTVSGGTESNDNSLFSVSGGTTYIFGADAIDSNGNMTMTGGTVFSNGPSSGAEEYCDINGTCNMNGGIFVGCGTSGMQKAPSTTSTQPCLFIKATFASSTMYTLSVGGNAVLAFKPKNGGGACLITAPQMTKGAAYIIYSGGSYTGGTSTNNFYQNGTFSNSGASTFKSGTLSSSSTVNSL